MVDWLYSLLLTISLSVGVSYVAVGLWGFKPNGRLILGAAVLEVGLLVQLAVSSGMALAGARAAVSTLEFFGYLLVALIVIPGAVVWALTERSRWSTVVIGFGHLTVAVMLLRMWQIWFGSV